MNLTIFHLAALAFVSSCVAHGLIAGGLQGVSVLWGISLTLNAFGLGFHVYSMMQRRPQVTP